MASEWLQPASLTASYSGTFAFIFIIEEKLDKWEVGKGWWNADKDLLVIPVPPHVVRGRVGIPGIVEQVHSKSGAFRHIAVTVTVQPLGFQGVK